MAATMNRSLPEALSLEGRRVAVTGAGSGIGRATALAVAKLGASVLVTDRAGLPETQAAVAALGSPVEVLEGDLTAPGFTDALLARGPFDGLAHCAGIYYNTPLHEDADPLARFNRMMDINVRVPVELATAFVDHMAERSGGAIVLIGSVAGRNGGSSMLTPVDYAASKGAIHTVVRWLSRRAVGKGVLVNAVAPGPISTPMTGHGVNTDVKRLPRGRMGQPEEIAWMIAMLLTPAAGYVSGAVLDITGGTFVG